MTQLPNSPVNRPVPTKGQPNIYTVLSFLSVLMLVSSIGFVLYRSSVLFGSVGELFNLTGTAPPPRLVQTATPAQTSTKDAAPATNGADDGGDEE